MEKNILKPVSWCETWWQNGVWSISASRTISSTIPQLPLKYKHFYIISYNPRCGSRIWSRGGGPQLPRPKVADVAEQSRASEASYLRPGSRAHLRALEAFEFFSAQICILPHSRASFSLISDIYIKTKNLQLLLNEKWYAEGSEAGKFLNSNCKNSKILKKKYAERSKAKKIRKKLDRAPKWSILGPQNLASGGGPGPLGPPPLDPLVQPICSHSLWIHHKILFFLNLDNLYKPGTKH